MNIREPISKELSSTPLKSLTNLGEGGSFFAFLSNFRPHYNIINNIEVYF